MWPLWISLRVLQAFECFALPQSVLVGFWDGERERISQRPYLVYTEPKAEESVETKTKVEQRFLCRDIARVASSTWLTWRSAAPQS
jgi:hypothetical protein